MDIPEMPADARRWVIGIVDPQGVTYDSTVIFQPDRDPVDDYRDVMSVANMLAFDVTGMHLSVDQLQERHRRRSAVTKGS